MTRANHLNVFLLSNVSFLTSDWNIFSAAEWLKYNIEYNEYKKSDEYLQKMIIKTNLCQNYHFWPFIDWVVTQDQFITLMNLYS